MSAFRLATVLRVRRRQEEAARLRLQQANAAVAAVEAGARRAAERYAAAREASAGLGQGLGGLELARRHAADVRAAAVAVAQSRADRDDERSGWVEAARRVELLEALEDRFRAAQASARLRAEDQLAGELALARHARARGRR